MTSKVIYIGNLRCESEHLQSGSKILTDAPTDNHGKGEKFSPTDLCATSLAECALTTIAILGKNKNLTIDGAYCNVKKIMLSNPRRIGEIICDFHFSEKHPEEERKMIEEIAHECPVAQSLHADLKQSFTFNYDL